MQARSQDLEKGGGGYFERVRKVQTTLTRIFIVLESVSHGFSENQGGISQKSRNFKHFTCPKWGNLKKKKKGLHRFWDWFFGQNRKFQSFFLPISGDLQKKKKKRSSPILRLVFRPKSENRTFEGGCFPMGGLFSIFHQKSASKAPKTCDFATSQAYGGATAPPAPPGYATVFMTKQKSSRKIYEWVFIYS